MFDIDTQDKDQETRRRKAIKDSETTQREYTYRYLPFIQEAMAYFRDAGNTFSEIALWRSKEYEIALKSWQTEKPDLSSWAYVNIEVKKGRKRLAWIQLGKSIGYLQSWETKPPLNPREITPAQVKFAIESNRAVLKTSDNLLDFESVFTEAFPVIRAEHMAYLETKTDSAEQAKARVNLNLEFK